MTGRSFAFACIGWAVGVGLAFLTIALAGIWHATDSGSGVLGFVLGAVYGLAGYWGGFWLGAKR